MKMEKEITVLVTCDYNQLHQELINEGFNIKEEYELNDDYMLDSRIDISKMNKLDILKNCILIRNIVGIKKVLLYKYKKYDENENIIEQGKIECPIEDINKAIKFMEAINYKHLFKIYDKCIVYANNKSELVVQLVNNEYIFIEMEDKCEHIDKIYNSIEEMINDLNSYNLSFDRNNYFVKKAELILEKNLN